MPIIDRQGVKLHYEEAGSGGPPLLFVHGFAGDARHFEPQLEHFRARHRVVALDRRGHGRSDKPQGPYDVPAIADEVAFCARELGLHRPVLVVHSMGGIAFEVAARHPELLSALVIIDAPLFAPGPVLAHFRELGAGLATPEYREVIDAACDRMVFLPTDDRPRRQRLHAAMLETPQHVLASTWRHFVEHDPGPAARQVRLPVLFIAGVMPHDEAALRAACPQVQVGRTACVGHFAQLEAPGQVNAMTNDFLRSKLQI